MDTDSTKWLKLRSGSDIRGPAAQLNDETAEKIGYAFACAMAEKLGTTPDRLKIAVGRDSRASGKRVLAALIRGITAADSDVLDCGLCAAPALYMTVGAAQPPEARAEDDAAVDTPASADGAVMVTASHHAAGLNGFKFLTRAGGLNEEEVAGILRRAAGTTVPERLVIKYDAGAPYAERLRRTVEKYLEDDALRPLLGMHVIVDGSGGPGGAFAAFLESLGAETDGSLHLEPDGGFPDHAPDTEDPTALEALRARVLEYRADLGVIFDADCDRCAIVDESGRVYHRNRLIALVAAMLLDKEPGATIVTDSVTSSGLSAFIAEWGGVHYRFKRGYRNVIDEAARLNAEGIDCPLAIETTGHAAFRENEFLDDGIYLATRIICEAFERKREGDTLATLIEGLAEPVERTEIRMRILDEEAPAESVQEIVEMILSHTLENPEWQMALDSREGVRITFNLDGGVNNAWFQLRMSIHDPVVVLNAESDVAGGVRRVLGALYQRIGGTDALDLAPLRAALENGEA